MSSQTAALAAYLPVVLYLLVVTVDGRVLGRIPFWVHPALIVPGLIFRVLTPGPWTDVALAAGCGTLMFLGGVFFLARVVSGATLFTVIGAFFLAPLWWGYPGILAGLVAAGLYSGWRTSRRVGRQQVSMLALQTVFALGVSPAGIQVPDPEAIPGKKPADHDDVEDVLEDAGPANPLRIQPFLLAGILLGVVLQVILR